MINFEIPSKVIHMASGKEIEKYTDTIVQHFETHKCPIMIGGDVYAYTIAGIAVPVEEGAIEYLIVDPHFDGKDTQDLISKVNSSTTSPLTNQKGVYWRDASLFKQSAFYNMCMPVIPSIKGLV